MYNEMWVVVNGSSNERGSCAALANCVAVANLNSVLLYRWPPIIGTR